MKNMKDMKVQVSDLCRQVIGSAIEVHQNLGPGLLESTYEQCLAYELKIREIELKKMQHPMPVNYKEKKLECGYRVDMLIEDELIVELKSVEVIKPIHEAQLLTYMKLAKIKQGLLINFNERLLKNGLKSYLF